MDEQTEMFAAEPKRRLAWAIYEEGDGVGVIVTDLDTEQWAAASAHHETPARALAMQRLSALGKTRRGAGSGNLIEQCRAHVLRSEPVPAWAATALLRMLDEASPRGGERRG